MAKQRLTPIPLVRREAYLLQWVQSVYADLIPICRIDCSGSNEKDCLSREAYSKVLWIELPSRNA